VVSPTFNMIQRITCSAVNKWAFLTAWNLATGVQSVSPSWYKGRSVWSHPVTAQQQWIARFVYDQGTGQTRELAWFYSQPHVQ